VVLGYIYSNLKKTSQDKKEYFCLEDSQKKLEVVKCLASFAFNSSSVSYTSRTSGTLKQNLIRSDLPLMVRQAHHERKINEL
jgi:hypothetical protein